MHKKILIITDNLPEQINGVVTTFKNIETHAILGGYSILYLDPRQFLHFSCPGYPEVKLSLPWQIGKKIEEMAPDYIHIATEGPIGLFARFYLDKRGYRYNTSYHTKFPEFLNQIYKVPENITWSYLRWFHKHSGIVLTNTSTMVKELHKRGFFGPVKSWTRGVDRNTLVPTKKRNRNEPPMILYVGRVSKEKDIEKVCELQHKYKVVIVGDGPHRKTLESKYTNVQFVGYRTGSELANWYHIADVLAFPSKVDTFGLVIIEAMSLGTPVAAYPVPGPIDIIEPETGTMHDDLELAIERCLYLNRELVQEKSKKWDWENCWKTFKNNLVEIV
jgi:glycosyltransferase involved in cell wall biosynthesis